jgi:hypothetical protein
MIVSQEQTFRRGKAGTGSDSLYQNEIAFRRFLTERDGSLILR